jgi:hypothetical protein
MFTSITDPTGLGYPFEKIRHAISHRDKSHLHAATSLGLNIVVKTYETFRQELDAAGALGNWEYDLDTYEHAITVLQDYFTANTRGLTERDARIYYHYLETEHEQFCQIAQEHGRAH